MPFDDYEGRIDTLDKIGKMSPIRTCAIWLLMLGTASCALDGDNSSGTNVPQTASDAEGRLLEKQRQDTCLQHPEYCRR